MCVGAREGKIAQEDYIRQETGHPSFQSMIGKFEDTFNLQVRHYFFQSPLHTSHCFFYQIYDIGNLEYTEDGLE